MTSVTQRKRCWLFVLIFSIASSVFVRAGAANSAAWELQVQALHLSEAGRYLDAEPLFKQAIELEEAQPRRTWTYRLCLLRCLRNYIVQEKYGEAIPLLEKLFEIYSQGSTGEGTETTDRIFVADCLNDSGEFLMVQHKYKEADPLLIKALRLREILRQSDLNNDRQNRYIDSAATKSALGRNLNAQRKYDEAQTYLNQAAQLLVNQKADLSDWLSAEIADAQIKALTGLHKQVPPKLKHTAYGFYQPGNFDVASKWAIYLKAAERIIYQDRKWIDCCWHRRDTDTFFEKAVREAEKFGSADMRLAGTLMRFGRYQILENKGKESLPNLARALDIASKSGIDRLDVCSAYLNGIRAQEKYPSFMQLETLELLKQEIKAYKTLEGSKSKQARTLCKEYVEIVASNKGIDDRWKAKQYQAILPDIENSLGLFSPLTIEALSTCVEVLHSNMQYYDAMILQRKIVAGSKEIYGARSRQTGLALKEYAQLLYETNDIENAKLAEQEANAILQTAN